ncbi:hypothetical protein CYLTODRAFT_417370 [Cylindrobasidium torrendii FP15055 ss-10]|uniref:WW domain-containing protein n=1 Tax=Cylindrobasidium torrendii FP15055 ss-10 TaxID=1314674 RepID=A0A0D7BS87_9AGAR|nr:hypothetical protein CYLTODRAFT_417370 [Cylindrobasidium torrendii FP15055 ss-10]
MAYFGPTNLPVPSLLGSRPFQTPSCPANHRVASFNHRVCLPEGSYSADDIHSLVPDDRFRYPQAQEHPSLMSHRDKLTTYTSQDRRNLSPTATPRDWTKYIHPEGLPYFYNKSLRVIVQRELTDQQAGEIFQIKEIIDQHLPPNNDFDVVIDPRKDGDSRRKLFFTYIVDHKQRSIFWLDDNLKVDVDTFQIPRLNSGMLESHCEYLYWKHIGFFPDVREQPAENWDELESSLLHLMIDVSGSSTTTCTLKLKDLENMDTLAKSAREKKKPFALGRYMSSIWEDRLTNHYGQPWARLNSGDSVYVAKDGSGSSLWFNIVAALLFGMPTTYLDTLRRVWPDKITSMPVWTEEIKPLDKDWDTYNLLSTVFLNANLAFLAIGAGDSNKDGAGKDESSGRTDTPDKKMLLSSTFSYLSILCLLVAIVITTTLQRRHRKMVRSDVRIIHDYMQALHASLGNFEGAAVVYSLPIALLLWSVVFFSIAFLIMCFANTIWWSNGVIIGGTTVGLLVTLLGIAKLLPEGLFTRSRARRSDQSATKTKGDIAAEHLLSATAITKKSFVGGFSAEWSRSGSISSNSGEV